jgi:hypothetical protein
METELLSGGIVPFLAQGPLWLFAIVIGVVVSMDVAAVELTCDYRLEERNGKPVPWTTRMREMALLHAAFHAGAFLIYLLFIYLLQSVAAQAFEILAFFDIIDLPPGVWAGLLALVNFFIACFIWWTYRSKIREDHSEKSHADYQPNRGDMALFVDVVRTILGKRLLGVAVAGSVAVDMLAVSALLKSFLLPDPESPPISSFSGVVVADIALFAAIIFAVVFVTVLVCQLVGSTIRQSHATTVFLRLAEPFVVFFILAGAVRIVAERSFGAINQNLITYGNFLDALFAAAIVVSLLWSNGFGIKKLSELSGCRRYDDPAVVERSWAEVRTQLKRSVPAFSLLFLVLFPVVLGSLIVAYGTNPGPGTHNHLIEATSYIAFAVLLGSIIVIYTPSKRLDNWERDQSANFRSMTRAKPRDFLNRLGAVILAILAINVYNFAVIGKSVEVWAILLWSFYVTLSWALFDLRRWRFYKSDPTGESRKENDSDYAELITAIGLASSVIIFVVQFVVRTLIGD